MEIFNTSSAIHLSSLDVPSTTKFKIYKNGDGSYKLVSENLDIKTEDGDVRKSILTIPKVTGIKCVDNYTLAKIEDIAESGTVYILPDKNKELYNIKIDE